MAKPNLLHRVGANGVIEGFDIETHYHHCDSVYVDHDNEFIGAIFDNDATDGETRIMFDTLRRMGFVIPAKAQMDALRDAEDRSDGQVPEQKERH